MIARLPPFGKRIVDLRRRGLVPNSGQVAISVGSWSFVNRKREDAIVVPPGEDPAAFDWRLVAGLPVVMVVHERQLMLADRVAAEVIAAGCRGCLALIQPAFGERFGSKLYQSHFSWEFHLAA